MPNPKAFDDATLDRARALIAGGASQRAAARELGINEKTLGQRLHPRQPRATTSVKRRLLQAITEHPDHTGPEIAAMVGTDVHTAVHLIWSLQKQGLVRFDERPGERGITMLAHIRRRPGSGGSDPSPIWAPPAPSPTVTYDAVPVVDGVATLPDGSTVASTAQEVMVPTLEFEPVPLETDGMEILAGAIQPVYPLLDRLRSRAANLAAAAQLLEAAGQDELALAVMDQQDRLTDVEREYLRFATAMADEYGLVLP